MKTGWLINPTDKTITPASYETWREIAPLISCQHFDVARTSIGDIYVDDEGMTNADKYFQIDNRTLAGNGLLMGGCDIDGETLSSTKTLAEIKKAIRFGEVIKINDKLGFLACLPKFGLYPLD